MTIRLGIQQKSELLSAINFSFFALSDYVETSGSNITKLIDLSGRGHHALPQTSSPTLVSSVLNGRPAMRFNNTNQAFYIPKKFGNTAASKITAFMLVNVTGASREVIFNNRNVPTLGEDGWEMSYTGDAINPADRRFQFALVGGGVGTAPLSTGVNSICVARKDGLAIDAWVNGATNGQGIATGYTPETGSPNTYIGEQDSFPPTPDKYFGGDMFFLAITEQALSLTQINYIERWIKNTYGLP